MMKYVLFLYKNILCSRQGKVVFCSLQCVFTGFVCGSALDQHCTTPSCYDAELLHSLKGLLREWLFSERQLTLLFT